MAQCPTNSDSQQIPPALFEANVRLYPCGWFLILSKSRDISSISIPITRLLFCFLLHTCLRLVFIWANKATLFLRKSIRLLKTTSICGCDSSLAKMRSTDVLGELPNPSTISSCCPFGNDAATQSAIPHRWTPAPWPLKLLRKVKNGRPRSNSLCCSHRWNTCIRWYHHSCIDPRIVCSSWSILPGTDLKEIQKFFVPSS